MASQPTEFNEGVALVDMKTGNPTITTLQKLNAMMRALTGTKSSLTATKAGVTQTATDLGHWLIEEPKDKTYTVAQKVARACTITEVTTRCTAGTATVTIKINGTSLGGTANSASTTEQSQSHSSANEVAAGDTVTIVVSSTSGAEMISVSIAGTVTLDP